MNNRFTVFLKSKTEEEQMEILKNSLFHLLEAGKIKEAASLLTNEEFIEEKYKIQDAETFIDDIYNAYVIIKKHDENLTDAIASNLFKFFIKKLFDKDDELTPEVIHALLVYRKDSGFYDRILELSSDPKWVQDNIIPLNQEKFITIFQARLANVCRRKGNLDKAQKILQSCLQRLEKDENPDSLQLEEFSRIEYDLGYIHFLIGEAEIAIKYFDRSISHAQKADNIVGEWITRCIKMRCAFLYDLANDKEFEKTLKKAKNIFNKEAQSDPTAKRWLMNIASHLFEVTFYQNQKNGFSKHGYKTFFIKLVRVVIKILPKFGTVSKNVNDALIQFEFLNQDEWLKIFARENHFKPFEARIYMMKEQWSDAMSCFESYLPQTKQELEKFLERVGTDGRNIGYEGLSRDYLDYGKVFQKAGQPEKAKELWTLGLVCPVEHGNSPWHKKIRVLMDKQKTIGG